MSRKGRDKIKEVNKRGVTQRHGEGWLDRDVKVSEL